MSLTTETSVDEATPERMAELELVNYGQGWAWLRVERPACIFCTATSHWSKDCTA